MHAIKIVRRIFDDAPVRIHARRLQALWAAVQSLMEGGRLTLTALGRSMPSQARVKHSIKRVDRLLGNRLLHAQRADLYRPVVCAVLGSKKRPVLLVDWSGVSDDGHYHTLRASVAMNGRALSVYEEVHSVAHLGNRQVERNFLKVLQDLLPLDCCPIVVTDAGFRVPWCKQVQALGWDWITRIRSRTMFQQQNQGPFERCKTLWTQATTRARCIGQVTVAKSNPIACRLCLVRGKRTGRINRNKRGQRKRNRHSKRHHQAGREPWVLATSLEHTAANKIVRLYKLRMQIEQGFRDLKSPRFGFAMELHKTRCKERLQILLLICTLATLALWLLGRAAQQHNLQRHFQANTENSRHVLSALSLGRMLLPHPRLCTFPLHRLLQILAEDIQVLS